MYPFFSIRLFPRLLACIMSVMFFFNMSVLDAFGTEPTVAELVRNLVVLRRRMQFCILPVAIISVRFLLSLMNTLV